MVCCRVDRQPAGRHAVLHVFANGAEVAGPQKCSQIELVVGMELNAKTRIAQVVRKIAQRLFPVILEVIRIIS